MPLYRHISVTSHLYIFPFILIQLYTTAHKCRSHSSNIHKYTTHIHTIYECILIFVIEIISLYLPKESFVIFLPFKFSYPWTQFVFEICQYNVLLKYCTASFLRLYIKSATFNEFPFYLVLFIPHFCHSPVLKSSGYATKINRTLQVMPQRDLPSRET